MSETPRTDAAVFGAGNAGKVRASFARQLERALSAALKERDELLAAIDRHVDQHVRDEEPIDWHELATILLAHRSRSEAGRGDE